ncbi:MAG: hypothetical protein FJW20_24220 [Acidimicrobiia bacterium]|nr:hypothetical protein [Acidimicrobiia bacterium]
MPTTKKKASHKKAVAPTAIHAKHADGTHHLVTLANIRVVIVPDEGSWFAQGLDIDYAAQGETVPKARKNFEIGLRATINHHLKVYGHLTHFIKVAPPAICQHLLLASSAQFKSFSQISAHEIHEAAPFNNIEYLVAIAEGQPAF